MVEQGQTVVLPQEIDSAEFMAAFNDAMSHHHDDLHGEIHLLNHLLERLGVTAQGPAAPVAPWKRIWRRLHRG